MLPDKSGTFRCREVIGFDQTGVLKVKKFLNACFHNDLCRITHNNGIIRKLASYNTAGTYNAIISYCGIQQDYTACPDKNIIPYFNFAEDASSNFPVENMNSAIMGDEFGTTGYSYIISYLNQVRFS